MTSLTYISFLVLIFLHWSVSRSQCKQLQYGSPDHHLPSHIHQLLPEDADAFPRPTEVTGCPPDWRHSDQMPEPPHWAAFGGAVVLLCWPSIVTVLLFPVCSLPSACTQAITCRNQNLFDVYLIAQICCTNRDTVTVNFRIGTCIMIHIQKRQL